MNSEGYIPRSDSAFLLWVKKLLAYVMLNFERWRIYAPEEKVNVLLTEFEQTLQKAQEPNRGKVDVTNKNDARRALEKEIRTYVQGFLARNPYLTNADRNEMSLTVYDTISTQVGTPKVRAMGKIIYKGAGLLDLHIAPEADISEDRRAYYGCKIVFQVMDFNAPAPIDENELHESRFSRRKKESFVFQPKNSGKKIYFSIRYESSKGAPGPWCPIFSAVIP